MVTRRQGRQVHCFSAVGGSMLYNFFAKYSYTQPLVNLLGRIKSASIVWSLQQKSGKNVNVPHLGEIVLCASVLLLGGGHCWHVRKLGRNWSVVLSQLCISNLFHSINILPKW